MIYTKLDLSEINAAVLKICAVIYLLLDRKNSLWAWNYFYLIVSPLK